VERRALARLGRSGRRDVRGDPDAADLALDVRELGAAHLAGTTLGELARAGWCRSTGGRAGGRGRAWVLPPEQPAPWCPMVF
jgi:hypothetical protein